MEQPQPDLTDAMLAQLDAMHTTNRRLSLCATQLKQQEEHLQAINQAVRAVFNELEIIKQHLAGDAP